MAPEAPGNLVVVDLFIDENNELKGKAISIEYPSAQMQKIEDKGGWIDVLWNQTPGEEEGFSAIYEGVVYAKYPPGYKESPVRDFDPSSSEEGYSFRSPALGEGLMFVLIFPEGYSLTAPQPMCRSAKIYQKKRLAVYWKPDGKYGEEVKITWRIKDLDRDIKDERNRINSAIYRAEDVPNNPGVDVKDELNRKLQGEQIERIHQALINGYSNLETLSQMLRFELNETLSLIAGGSNVSHVVFNLIEWAENEGRIQELVTGAQNRNQGNILLQKLVEDLKSWSQ